MKKLVRVSILIAALSFAVPVFAEGPGDGTGRESVSIPFTVQFVLWVTKVIK